MKSQRDSMQTPQNENQNRPGHAGPAIFKGRRKGPDPRKKEHKPQASNSPKTIAPTGGKTNEDAGFTSKK